MLRYIFQPDLIEMYFSPYTVELMDCPGLQSLGRLCTDTDIMQDPYVIKLRSDPAMLNSKTLRKTLTSRKTYCMQQLQKVYSKAEKILPELGSWASDFYLRACIRKFVTGFSDGSVGFEAFDDAELKYLKKLLNCIEIPAEAGLFLGDIIQITPKVQCLIDFLVREQSASLRGLVFVQTRAQVAMLAKILSQHPQTKGILKVSTFVGTSASPNRKFDLGDLVDVKDQEYTLDNLRNGSTNLIITTTALEEGIDVSACNVVVCFERPQTMNLKSFIQRRGRARKSKSKFVLMFERDSDTRVIKTWHQLEREMREAYMDDMRILQDIHDLEAAEEGERDFFVKSTGCVPSHLFVRLLSRTYIKLWVAWFNLRRGSSGLLFQGLIRLKIPCNWRLNNLVIELSVLLSS